MSLADRIQTVIRGVLSSNEDAQKIVTHLLSDDIGVTKLSDLSEVTLDILPSNVKIPFVKRRPLMDAIASLASGAEHSGAATSPSASTASTTLAAPASGTFPGTSIANVIPDHSVFTFTVPWKQMPDDVMKRLETARDNKVKAAPGDIEKLKLAIAKKLKSLYNGHKEIYPGCQKNPGRKIYQSVTDQVASKFGDSFKTVVKGAVMGGGTSNFFRSFESCVENLMRDSPSGIVKSNVARGKSVVGVDLDAYNPIMTTATKEVQQGIKEHLKNIKFLETDHFDWPVIIQNLKETYELQREEILHGTAKIVNATATDPDEPEEKVFIKLKQEWPFLFEMKGMEVHHQTLTKRDLGRKMKIFIDELCDVAIYFLITCSKTNVQNLIIRMKLETNEPDYSPEVRFMSMVNMVANHMGENFGQLFLPAERTAMPEELAHTILQEHTQPCIVALDSDVYAAKQFVVCADQVPLLQTNNPKDALKALIEVCFVFDLEYPPAIPFTMEFIERYVLDMGLLDTKCKKKGRRIQVLSETIKKFIGQLEEFGEVLKKENL